MDMPKGRLPAIGEYQQITGLKTAPLFEVACDLGVRAAQRDWHCGMAFQAYDDLTDLLKAVAQDGTLAPRLGVRSSARSVAGSRPNNSAATVSPS